MRDSIVIGKGMVGQATMYALGIEDYVSLSDSTVSPDKISDFKYIFICLPTPTRDGIQDTSLITDYVVDISAAKKDNIFIIRSTVLPGFCRSLQNIAKVVHVPEFLTEKTWKADSEWPDIVVVGSDDITVGQEVLGIFKARYKGADFFYTDTVTSETIKYAINSLYATKVIFANQLYDYCQTKGINYETVKSAMYARQWIGKNHLEVWHQGGRGGGGKCLKKDVDAFANSSQLPLLKLVSELNHKLLDKFPKDEAHREVAYSKKHAYKRGA